jgi:NodT family efflux transporter outer membrane factor (OMF) lipoprotein
VNGDEIVVTQYQAPFGRRLDVANALGDRTRWIFAAALLLSTAACTIGPDFTAPVAPLAEKFRDVDNRSVKSGTREYQNWWGGFRDPTLNKLVQIAYNQNLTLLSAGTRVLQARAVLGIAIGEFYPQVQQGVGSVINNKSSAATPLSPPNATPSYFWTDALAAQAAWELDFWGKFRRGVESADAAYLASIASYDGVLVSLLADVTATYIGIRTTEQLIGIARDNVRKQEQALSIAKAKYQGGGTSELDVFQATNVLEQTRAAIPQLTIQLQQGENALCVLLGVPPQSLGMLLSRSVGRIPSPPRTVVVGIPADLLRRRPDVRAAELAALAQSAQIGVAETQLYLEGGSLCRRSVIPMEYPELWADHQQRSLAGCKTSTVVGRLSEHRVECAAGSRQWSCDLPAIAKPGRVPASQRPGGKWRLQNCYGAV